jgi:hypothetical protein
MLLAQRYKADNEAATDTASTIGSEVPCISEQHKDRRIKRAGEGRPFG